MKARDSLQLVRRALWIVSVVPLLIGACVEQDLAATSAREAEVTAAQACWSTCDCSHGEVCNEGQCQLDFGPYPECYEGCSARDCGFGQVCSDNVCVGR